MFFQNAIISLSLLHSMSGINRPPIPENLDLGGIIPMFANQTMLSERYRKKAEANVNSEKPLRRGALFDFNMLSS